jgi:hypothetical protein
VSVVGTGSGPGPASTSVGTGLGPGLPQLPAGKNASEIRVSTRVASLFMVQMLHHKVFLQDPYTR